MALPALDSLRNNNSYSSSVHTPDLEVGPYLHKIVIPQLTQALDIDVTLKRSRSILPAFQKQVLTPIGKLFVETG